MINDVLDKFNIIADYIKSGKLKIRDAIDSINILVDYERESEKSFPLFISQSDLRIIGKNCGRSKSIYLKDSSSHKRIYEMAKSQVVYINNLLSENEDNKVIVIIPKVLGGKSTINDIRTNGLKIGTSEFSRVFMSRLSDSEYEEYGISKENPHDSDNLKFIQEWISERIIDPKRVIFINGNRQIYKENSIKRSIINATSNGYTNVCFFFKPVRDNRKFKFECAKFKDKSKYSEVEFEWISWIMRLVYENTGCFTKVSFAFSRDYNTILKMIKQKYSCTISELVCDEYKYKIIENRINYALETEHPNENDENFYKLISHFKSLLHNGIYEVVYSIQDIIDILEYDSKPSNIFYKLNRPKYKSIFKIKCLSDPKIKCRNKLFKISFNDRFLQINESMISEDEKFNEDLISNEENNKYNEYNARILSEKNLLRDSNILINKLNTERIITNTLSDKYINKIKWLLNKKFRILNPIKISRNIFRIINESIGEIQSLSDVYIFENWKLIT